MPLNKGLLAKARHQNRIERLHMASLSLGQKEDTYTVYDLEDRVIARGVRMQDYITKGWHLERYSLVKE